MRKANTRLIIIVIVLLLAVYVGASRLSQASSHIMASRPCVGASSAPLKQLTGRVNAQKVKQKLADSVARKRYSLEEVTISLKDQSDFNWDRVYIFPPHTGIETINETLGFVWPHARSIRMDWRDDINLIVFTDNGRVVDYVEYPRSLGDLKGNYKREGYSPDEAIFAVVEGPVQPDGRPWLRLRPHNRDQ